MNWRIRTTFLAVLAVAGAMAACGKKDAKYDINLLKNGSFESVSGSGVPNDWTLEIYRGAQGLSEAQYGLDREQVMDGKASWFFRGDTGTRRWYMLSQEVAIPEGSSHVQVRGWIQTHDTKSMPEQYAQCNFLISFFDSDHQRFQGMRIADQRTPFRSGTSPWLEEGFQFRLPDGTRFVKLSCVLGASGQAWFDNVSVVIPTPTQWETASTPNYMFHWLPGHPMPEGSQQSQQQVFEYVESRLNLQSDVIINYYFYPDTATIREMLSIHGHQSVSWPDREIHSINPNDNHEVVHFITDEIGRPPRALTEGTVFWLLDDFNGKTIDECMDDVIRAGPVPGLKVLLDPTKLMEVSSALTMPSAASFIGFLVRRWGPEKLMKFYAAASGTSTFDEASKAFQPVYGLTLAQAEEAWLTVVRSGAQRSAGTP